ncbi:MAG: 4Fe-4S dicluster domain-containing protein [Aggregatilineales bacterium]
MTPQRSLYQEVMAETPHGKRLATCLQCGTCGGSCPSAAEMDATPRRLFALLAAGEDDAVLTSNTPWYCVACYLCMVRCPQEIPITDLLYTIKQKAVERGLYHRESHVEWSESFVGYVERYGRSFEFGLATRYHLFHQPLTMARKTGLGFDLLRKRRLAPTPDRIEHLPQLKAILDEARRIAAEKELS